MDRYIISLIEILQWAMLDDDDDTNSSTKHSSSSSTLTKKTHNKIVVFFPVARMVSYFSAVFKLVLGIDVVEMHSRKSQSYRNKASDRFREARNGIMFTSDVSARGVDYPNVSHVIQFGMPEKKEQYIHRLGRTGRAGKAGKGLLVLAPFEAKFLNELRDLDVQEHSQVKDILGKSVDKKVMEAMDEIITRIENGDKELTKNSKQCYQAFLGFYLTGGIKKQTSLRNKEETVFLANHLSSLMGLYEPPGILKKAAGFMGLKGVKGVRIVTKSEWD